jgi:dTDP-4-dehydrorhamnose reductase
MPTPTRVLILGANGRLGQALTRCYRSLPELSVTPWTRHQLDLTPTHLIPRQLDKIEYDVIINTAGMTDVDACEQQPELALQINAHAPQAIAQHCANTGRRLIHLSTDYVFSGSTVDHHPLTEECPTDPCNQYGISKLRGEQALHNTAPQHSLIARVSWLFGPDKPSFPDMILQRALKGEDTQAVNDKWSSPSYSDDLAHWLLTLILHHPQAHGTYHLCNQGAPSWQQYGQATIDIAQSLGYPIRTRQVGGHSMQGFSHFRAQRPPYTALSTAKFTALSGIQPRPWEQAIEAWLRQIAPQ